jgi:hypothetical protein
VLKVADQSEKTSATAAKYSERCFTRLWPGWLFFLCLAAATLVVALDTKVRISILEAATKIQTAEETTAHAAATKERSTILQAEAMDARWWVMLAEEASLHGQWRIRDTRLDNAPEGREVHWSSGPIWILRATAAVLTLFAGIPSATSVQQAALWFGPITLAFGIGLLSLLAGRRFGWGYAGMLALILTTALPVYGNFRAGEPDHHGLVLLALVGGVLSLIAGGAGIVTAGTVITDRSSSKLSLVPARNSAGRYFALGGLLGAAGMWISAATTIPVLAGCGLGGLAAAALHRRNQTADLVLAPELWRIWSYWGSGGCLAFYLLEYFPQHMGLRLEVNHPLYALAWLGAGEILCQACRLAGGFSPGRHWGPRIAAACCLLALPAVVITFATSDAFRVADPYLLALHKNHIREFAPLLDFLSKQHDLASWVNFFAWPLFSLLGMAALLWAGMAGPWPSLFAFALAPAAVMQTLGFVQVRWEGIAMGLWSVCAILALLAFLRGSRPRRVPPAAIASSAMIAALALAAFPQFVVRRFLAKDEISANLSQSLAPSILLRDVAHRLVESSKSPVVLSDPTSSTELAYFGGVGVIGTLYWENLPGLEKSAWLYAAPDEKSARERLHSAGITHLVFPSWDDFTPSSFLQLLEASGKAPQAAASPYLDEVLQGKAFPQWLRPYYYPIPESFGLPGEQVRIFEVRFDQTTLDAWLFWAEYFVKAEDYPTAKRLLEKARDEDPANPDVARWLAALSRKIESNPTQPSQAR